MWESPSVSIEFRASLNDRSPVAWEGQEIRNFSMKTLKTQFFQKKIYSFIPSKCISSSQKKLLMFSDFTTSFGDITCRCKNASYTLIRKVLNHRNARS